MDVRLMFSAPIRLVKLISAHHVTAPLVALEIQASEQAAIDDLVQLRTGSATGPASESKTECQG